MYVFQSITTSQMGEYMSSKCTVMNGVTQRVVLSPILFAVYTYGLLKRLEDTGVGCHMGSRFTGAVVYAGDITLLAPCKLALAIIVKVCQSYTSEFDMFII